MTRSRSTGWSAGILVVLLIVAGWFLYKGYVTRQNQTEQKAELQREMSLTQMSDTTAPNFTLTDQNGNTMSLASLKGKVVVLSFMDPHCTDICPIVSAEFREAYRQLGSSAKNVEFVAVNVNQYAASTADLRAFSKENGLSTLPNWHFLTGSTADLQKVWSAYGITVIPNKTGDVEHSSFMYFISPDGNQRYVANPVNDKSTESTWAAGIANVSRQIM